MPDVVIIVMQQVDEEDEDDDEEEQDRVVVDRQDAVGELPPSETESEDSDEEGTTAKSSGDKVGRPTLDTFISASKNFHTFWFNRCNSYYHVSYLGCSPP